MSALTMTSTWMNAVLDGMAREGLDRAALTADIRGFSGGRIAGSARIEVSLARLIWRRAAELSSDPLLGVKIGSQLPLQAGHVMTIIRIHSATLRDFLTAMARYQPLLSEAGRYRMTPTRRGLRLTYVSAAAAIAPHPLQIDSGLAALVSYGPRPQLVRLIGRGNQDPAPQAQWLNCPVAFGATQAQVDYDHAALTARTEGTDPALLALNLAYADSLLAAHRPLDALCDSVRAAIGRRGLHHATVESVARDIGCSPRTLQRRLAGAGSSFKAIFDSHRMEEAHILLSKSHASIAEIGERLGYSESSAFSRAVTSWWGQSPRALRKAQA
ncbi:helix-turn-helix transcriptional regulator [Bradyrhizobium prioriisuperbiae]|uniref:helix-turn-helix transcriptional regulator n=1 Tax=Bradyrhizobium prioriisuperbiae TaxID=2854389 RepID=UPI0028E2DF4A|nr:helix-turn-helix domain-containing protein [Bradyrhizobium prioritasuperba]